MQNPSTQFPLGVLQGLGWNTVNNLPLETAALNVILATLNHTNSQIKLNKTYSSMLSKNPRSLAPEQCFLTNPAPDTNNPWVINGPIPNHGR